MAAAATELNPDAKSSRNGGLPGSPCHASEAKVSQKIGPSNDTRGYWPSVGSSPLAREGRVDILRN